MKKILFAVLSFVLFPAVMAVAGDLRFEARLDRDKAALGEAIQLNLSFQGTQNIPAPDLGKLEGFDARYLGPSTMVSIVNGVVTNSITHIYTLIPLKTGTFAIGPFSIEAQGKTLTSKPLTVEVVSASSAGRQPYSSGQALDEPSSAKVDEQELKDRIFLILSLKKRRAYLNEVIPLTVKLYVDRLSARDIQFPELETNDFSIEKFAQPKQYREEFGGVLYDVIEFNADMFAVKSGEFVLGPAKLKCNLVARRRAQRARGRLDDDSFGGLFNDDIFEDFFGRYEAYPLELESASLPVTILPLPEEGKPEGFDGALGNFQLDVEAGPLEVKAGDPITLKMTVRGEGNFDSVKPPRLESATGFKVYDPQARQNENAKVFEQVIIPDSEKITRIPRIDFSFFDTQTGQYRVLTRNPIPITVSRSEEPPAGLIEPPQAQIKPEGKEELGRDIIYLKGSPGRFNRIGSYLYQSPGFWSFQAFSLIAFSGIFIFNLRRERLISDRRYARRLRAPAKAKKGIQEIAVLLRENKAEAFFDAVFRTIREYLADRFHLPLGGITSASIEEIAKEKNISEEALNKIKKIFVDCDMARYSPGKFGKKELEDIFQGLKEVIDYLEKHKV